MHRAQGEAADYHMVEEVAVAVVVVVVEVVVVVAVERYEI